MHSSWGEGLINWLVTSWKEYQPYEWELTQLTFTCLNQRTMCEICLKSNSHLPNIAVLFASMKAH